MKNTKILTEELSLYYGEKQALNNISMQIPEKQVTAFIGPSGCGKSTYLRVINRMNDLIGNVRITGKVLVDGIDIYEKELIEFKLKKTVSENIMNCLANKL